MRFLLLITVTPFLHLTATAQSLPAGGNNGPAGGASGWTHFEDPGFPKHSLTLTVYPGRYSWEGSETSKEAFTGQKTPHRGQLIYSTEDGVSSTVQGQVDNDWVSGDESRSLLCITKKQHSEYWTWEGNPRKFQPTDFGGTATLSFNLKISGTTGTDSGFWADPATSNAQASVAANWAAGPPISYTENVGLEQTGWSDNSTVDSFVDTIGIGGATTAGGLKILGVVVTYKEIDNQRPGGSPYSYLATANVAAADVIEPVTVTSAGTITYTWNVSASAATQLYTNGNTASGTATAEATIDMNLSPVPSGTTGPGL